MLVVRCLHTPRPMQLQTAIGCQTVAHILGLTFKETVAAPGIDRLMETDIGLVIRIGIRMILKRAAFIRQRDQIIDINARHATCRQTRTHGFKLCHDFKHFDQFGNRDGSNNCAPARHGRNQPRSGKGLQRFTYRGARYAEPFA